MNTTGRLVIILLFILSFKITYTQKLETPSNEFLITIAKDGSGDYTTIQEAINNTKSFPSKRVTIHIKNGVYHEKVKIHEWNTRISLIGESKENTIITYNDYFDKINLGRNSTFYTATLQVDGNDFYATNLTIENTAGDIGQAISLTVNADRVQFDGCVIKGNQDTLYLTGEDTKLYFKNCFIEGTTDYIFGNATVFFDQCIIHSKKDSYITAASTPEHRKYGFVFKECLLTAAKNVTQVYLGRPWRINAKTVFIDCNLGKHITPQGWHSWSKPSAEKNAFYAEYNSVGEGSKPNNRVQWSHQLKKNQTKKYSLNIVLGERKKNVKAKWYLR